MEDASPSLVGLGKRFMANAAGALENRVELLAVEWQQEKARLASLIVWACAVLVLAVAGLVLAAAVVILMVEEQNRWWVAGLCGLFCLGASAMAFLSARRLIQHQQPFSGTIDQLRKDRTWLDSSQ